VHRILQLEANKTANKEQRAMLTEKLIDGILSGTFNPDIMFSVVHYKQRVQAKPSLRPESAVCFNGVHHMLQLALAISAIKRSDCAELQRLFDQGLQPDLWTEELILRPLDVAASVGDQALHKVLIANKCPMGNPRGLFEPWSNILTAAARCGNAQAVEEWTKEIQGMNYSYRDWMGHVICLNKPYYIWSALVETHHSAARGGQVEILELLDGRIKHMTAEKRFHSFIEAIKFGQCVTVEWFLDQGGVDLQMRTTYENKGPMSAALYDTNWRKRPQMVRLLLERGANPNEVFSPTGRTLLQKALEQDDSETARLLVEYGADVSSSGYGPTCQKKPPLSIAIKRKNAPMVQLLLRKGANRMYGGLCEKKNNKVRDIGHIEKTLKSLGWDDKEVRDKVLECFALNFEGIRNCN
jgi:ankyrin repeat protein